jgi:hypothetical protein
MGLALLAFLLIEWPQQEAGSERHLAAAPRGPQSVAGARRREKELSHA